MKYNRLTFSILLALVPLLIMSCSKTNNATHLSKDDRKLIADMIVDYQNGWLADDSTRVLQLFADTATILPNGMRPIQGKKAISQFWWPNDSSKTILHKYKIDILEMNGSNDWAYVYESGKLSWSYEKGNFKMSKDQESFEITIFKRTNGDWKIVKRIWTDVKL